MTDGIRPPAGEHGGSALRGPGAERRSEPRFDDLVLSTEGGPGVTGPPETDTARQTLRGRGCAQRPRLVLAAGRLGLRCIHHIPPSSPRSLSLFGTDHRPEHPKDRLPRRQPCPHRTGWQVPGVSPATHVQPCLSCTVCWRPRRALDVLGGEGSFLFDGGRRIGRRVFHRSRSQLGGFLQVLRLGLANSSTPIVAPARGR